MPDPTDRQFPKKERAEKGATSIGSAQQPAGPEATGMPTQATYSSPPPPASRPFESPRPQVSPSPPEESAPPAPEAAAATPPPPRRAFPVRIFLTIGLILLVAAIGFLAWRFLSPRINLGGKAEIVWWGLWEDETIVGPLIAEYQEKNPGVKVEYVNQSPQDYRERLTNAQDKGEGPDIFRFHNTWVPMFKNELDPVPSSVISPSEYATTYYSVVSSDLTSGSGLLGIPLEYDALALYINEDIFAQAAKSPPTTWDELRKAAIELTVKDEDGSILQSGVALGETENVDHWPEILALMMLQNGVNLARPTGILAEDALRFYVIFSSVDGVWDETLPPSTLAFANGKLAMYFAPSWRTFEIKRQNPDLRFRTVSLPQLPKDSPDQPDVSYATYWVEGVWKRSPSRQAAWKFLQFLSSKESLEKLYENASKTRLFGEPYPRADMGNLLADHPIAGSIILKAGDAQSWYLASRTFDGPTGINSQINKYFEDAINAVSDGTAADRALQTAASGVEQVLSQYGLLQR